MLFRSEAWGTPAKLWGAALEQAAYMPRPYLYLADEFKKEGDYTEALAHYKKALAVNPARLTGVDVRTAYNNLGVALVAKGDLSAAERTFQEALRLMPGNAVTHANLGAALNPYVTFRSLAVRRLSHRLPTPLQRTVERLNTRRNLRPPVMPEPIRSELRRYFAPQIEAVERWLDQDLAEWHAG